MGLSIRVSWKKIVKWVVWGILGILLLIYIVKVSTYENWYYNSKEGSERAAVTTNTPELDETVPTEAEVAEYTVAADRPRYLTVEKLGIAKARVLPVGSVNGEMGTPNNIFDVGWYTESGKPGQGGTMIIDGHNGGPHVLGVFKALPTLATGDIIQIERGDGQIFKYKVVENVSIPLSEADAYMSKAAISPEKGKESVTLISCTGDWSEAQGTYLSRQFTRAVITE
ncbi:class F sortase [Candidatus Saccharibacteria bacterium]|nr:class F sortase [Candidatus Saccharibacteria bacterium]